MKRRLFGSATGAFCSGLWGFRARAAPAAALPYQEAAWASQWRELRLLRGHFDGAPWNDAVDHWQGSKHRLMQQLASSLVSRSASATETLQALGPPDTVLRARDPAYAQVARELHSGAASAPLLRSSVKVEFWLYRWRGQHDQLALTVQQGRVVAAGWLHAYE